MVLYSVKKFLTIQHVPRITDFCSCIYVLRCRFRHVSLCDSEFGITTVHDITIGINDYYCTVSRHRPNDTLGLPLNSHIVLCLLYLHSLTVGALRYVFHHPLYLFTLVQIIFKFTQNSIYIYFMSNSFHF